MGSNDTRDKKDTYEGRATIMFTIVSKKKLVDIENQVIICYKLLDTMQRILINKNIVTEKEIADMISERELTENLRQSGSKFFKRKTL